MYDHIKAEDSEVYSAIMQEIGRQRNKIELIADRTSEKQDRAYRIREHGF